MSWTVSYQLVRERVLDAAERATLTAWLARVNAAPWDGEALRLELPAAPIASGVVARGTVKLPLDADTPDAPRLCTALTELDALIADARVRVEDDLVGIGWDAGAACFELGDHEERPLAKVPRAARFSRIGGVAPKPPAAVPPWLDPTRTLDARADAFVAMWRKPRGLYFYGDLRLPDDDAVDLLAHPVVRARLLADVDRVVTIDRVGDKHEDLSELQRRCADRALALLSISGAPAALHRLVTLARELRDVARAHHLQHYTYLPLIEGLGRRASVALAPTLRLALDGVLPVGRAYGYALSGLARVAPALALPLIDELLARGLVIESALAAAAELGAAGAPIAPAIESLLAFPLASVCRRARRALAAIRGVEAEHPADEPDAAALDPEPFVLHRDHDVRRVALRTLHDRRDVSLFRSLAVAYEIDAWLRRAIDWNTVPFGWESWRDIRALPAAIRNLRATASAAWARSPEAEVALGPQRLLPALARVIDLPVADVIATYASFAPPRLDAAARAELDAAELATLAELASSSIPAP